MRAPTVVFLLSALLAAQDRKAAVGRVLDADGQPVAGAAVTLFWTAPGDTLGEHPDRVEVATDQHGRFMVQLLPQRGYSAFAVGPAGTGPRQVSDVCNGLAAGADLELRLVRAAAPGWAELRGADAWQAVGPLRLVAFAKAVNILPMPLELRAGGAALPPVEVAFFAVFDGRGQALWTTFGLADKGVRAVDLPPPLELRFRVVDDKGAPVVGAQVLHSLQRVSWRVDDLLVNGPHAMPLRLLGTTGADGLLNARVPAARDPWRTSAQDRVVDNGLTFLASKPGCGTSVAALGMNPSFCNGETMPLPADHVLQLTLRSGLRRRLSPPIAGAGATLATTLRVAMNNGTTGFQWELRCDSDAEGWLDLPFPGPTETALLEFDDLRLPDGSNVQRAVLEISAADAEARCDLARLRRLSVQVLDAGGGPMRGVPVMLLPHAQNCPEASPAYTDQAGRVGFRVGRGDWLLLACDQEHAVWQTLRSEDGDQDWKLGMQTLPAMVCRLVGADGKPVAGAALRLANGTPTRPFPADGEGRLLYVLEQHFAHRLRGTARSDADGMVRVPMLGTLWSWNISFAAGSRQSKEICWQAGEQPVMVPVQ